jgi:hypothetical protein
MQMCGRLCATAFSSFEGGRLNNALSFLVSNIHPASDLSSFLGGPRYEGQFG